ncbi:MAG TPA: YlbF family regulator [Syntrophomonadaceae bacterium]|nr:YlbF family regulator [Syntrophomonadaceae bacterium]
MNTDEIIKLAFELGTAVANSKEITALKDKQTLITQDKESYDLIMRYQDTRNKVENGKSGGLIVGKSDEDLLSILEQQINNNALIKELMDAQQKFDSLMQGVYFAMNQAITGSGCSGGCDSCSSHCGE